MKMSHRITAFLCTLFLICGSGMAAAAEESPKVSAEVDSTGKSAEITVEGISAPIYGIQLAIQSKQRASALTLSSPVSEAYAVVKDGGSNGTVVLYVDAKQPLNSNGKILVGSLKGTGELSLGNSADLILVDRDLVGTEYSNVSVSISTKKDNGNGGGSGGGSNKKTENHATVVTPSASSEPSVSAEQFTDVAEHWAKDAISFVTAQGLFQGMSETEFMPDEKMTRAMFVTVLQRFGEADSTKWSLQSAEGVSFTDVSADMWYSSAVAWASGAGVVDGIGDGMFAPDAAVTREQLAVMIVRFTTLCRVELPQTAEPYAFTDAAEIQGWAADAVTKAQQAGIIQGRPEGSFDPKATATRAEVAAILQRMLNITK